MDGGDSDDGYLSKLTTAAEGEWAGWSCYPGGDPFEDLAGPFYFRIDEKGPVCAFRVDKKHLNGGAFLHGGCFMTFADFALFVIARNALREQHAVTATFNCELVGAAYEGQVIECRGEVVKNARSMVFVRGLMTTGGETIMSFSSTLKKRGPRKG
ncbi:MAG TPA: PaaI family thioesterase [Phenylobacterium sp.]|nr:PaaI family thioesterase [Phenylobacterium sp.]